MDAITALKTRRAVRAFRPDPVAREVIEDIVDCARLAASAINVQPWEFVVVTEPAMRQRLADITDYGKHIAQAPVCVAVLCRETKYYLEDGAAATENLMVAARAHGLGSCWVAGDKKDYAPRILEALGAPPRLKLISLVPMGLPAEQPEPPKRPLTEVLHWEKY
jgi:nitroreductase